jgi:hypothetical protein
MRIFITLPTATIPSSGANQWLGNILGNRKAYVVAASAPMACWGEWVFVLDISATEVTQYRVQNPLGPQDRSVEFFYIPVARAASVVATPYKLLTGREWNETVVTVMDRRAKRPKDTSVEWSLLWGSRRDLAELLVIHTSPTLVQVSVRLAKDFDFSRDYLCVETHTERANERVVGGVKESWWLGHLAGFAPDWATFPPAWKTWVYDTEVQQSAEEYILDHVPEAALAFAEARGYTDKQNVISGWHVVKDIVDRELKRELGSDVTVGKLASNSWTALTAMPLRLAQRLGNYVTDQWEPPMPKPDFADPETANRVLLANPTGTYPTYGQGVGERMADRYYMRREGEMMKTTTPPPQISRDFASPYR